MQFCTMITISFLIHISKPMETNTSLGYAIAAVVAFLIFCYLVYSLFKADKF
jgi:K+-transporting ATPase KdpF subunit